MNKNLAYQPNRRDELIFYSARFLKCGPGSTVYKPSALCHGQQSFCRTMQLRKEGVVIVLVERSSFVKNKSLIMRKLRQSSTASTFVLYGII